MFSRKLVSFFKDCSFPIEWSPHACQKSIDHRGEFICMFSILFVYSYASVKLFLLLWLCNMSVSGKRGPPSLFFFKIAVATCALAIHCTFLESICNIPHKIVLEILTENI